MDFEFVVTSDDPGNLSESHRQLVRRRATQEGARTRRRRAQSRTKVNLLQLPPWLASRVAGAQAGSLDLPSFESNFLAPPLTRSLSPDPQRSLQAVRGLLEFSKHDATKSLLSYEHHSSLLLEPLRIQKILVLTREQFFVGLGERYETSQCLKDAVDCLWAYLRQSLSPEVYVVNPSNHVNCYVRALNSLQIALNDGLNLDRTGIWYATLILILYESFSSSDHAWIMHACGAVHVLQHLGPRSIVTECHKDLLTAQSAIMITEAIFQNKTCFLSEPEWQSVMQSTIIQDCSSYSRSEAVVQLWMHAAHIPCIFYDTTHLVLYQGNIDRDGLISRTRAVCEYYKTWYQRWPHLESAVKEMSTVEISEIKGLQIELFCCYLEQFCLINRLLLALNPAIGLELEEAITETARRLLNIYREYAIIGQANYRIGLSAFVASSVLNTTDEWRLGLSGLKSNTTLTIEPAILSSWCLNLRRKLD